MNVEQRNPMSPRITNYRADVDGLRAVAVGAVLLFHAFPGLFPGGYVGVDIFFVISGFLITGILLSEIEQDRFSVLRFYVRRARRLFPALFLVLFTVLVIGWMAMLPSEFQALGKHVFGGAVFVSNILLWREVSYFDVASELKPLLHLWSLGVEEQYYLMWPLFLLVLARSPRCFWLAAVSLGLLTFITNVILIDRSPSSAFYLPVTRLWELVAGGLLAFGLKQLAAKTTGNGQQGVQGRGTWARWLPHAISVAGMLLVFYSIMMLDQQTEFPGWAALVPTAGAILVIAAGPFAVMNWYLLSSSLAVWGGLISYPLYLWHWPILAFARIVLGKDLSAALASALIVLSVALAWMTYRVLEFPFRSQQYGVRASRDAMVLWVLILLLGVAGVAAWMTWLKPRSNESPAVQRLDEAQADFEHTRNQLIPGDRPERVLFIGDSHMQQYLPRIEKIARDRVAPMYTLQFKTEAGCAPLSGIERKSIRCLRFVDEAFAAARDASTKTILIAASWYGFSIRDDYYRADDPNRAPLNPFAAGNHWIFERWADELRQLKDAGKRIVLVASSPRGSLVAPARLIDRRNLRWEALEPANISREILYSLVEPVDTTIFVVAREIGAEIVEPFDWLCDAAVCATRDAAGRPIYSDESHLRASFVRDRLTMLDRFVYITDEQGPRH
jgi:peptidoglycan/LPS O-acetylase OafA/YrhL